MRIEHSINLQAKHNCFSFKISNMYSYGLKPTHLLVLRLMVYLAQLQLDEFIEFFRGLFDRALASALAATSTEEPK